MQRGQGTVWSQGCPQLRSAAAVAAAVVAGRLMKSQANHQNQPLPPSKQPGSAEGQKPHWQRQHRPRTAMLAPSDAAFRPSSTGSSCTGSMSASDTCRQRECRQAGRQAEAGGQVAAGRQAAALCIRDSLGSSCAGGLMQVARHACVMECGGSTGWQELSARQICRCHRCIRGCLACRAQTEGCKGRHTSKG